MGKIFIILLFEVLKKKFLVYLKIKTKSEFNLKIFNFFLKISNDGTPAWTEDSENSKFYYHKYNKNQPDLNYRNPKVVDELKVSLLEFSYLEFNTN